MADTLKQIQAERERTLRKYSGATESSRAALSAITGRNVLKTKQETEKLRRDEEIAARQIAAVVEENAAEGAVTLAKARTTAELADERRVEQENRTRRNEALSMIKMGIYDDSFQNILNLPDHVIRSTAARKAEETAQRKATQAAIAAAKSDYENALKELQRLESEQQSSRQQDAGGNAAGSGQLEDEKKKLENAIDQYDATFDDTISFSVEENKLDPSAAPVKTDTQAREEIIAASGLLEAYAPPLSSHTRDYTQNIGLQAAKLTSPDPAIRKEALEEEEKELEERAQYARGRLQAAERYYNELLAKRVQEKNETGEPLSVLEAQFTASPAGILAMERAKVEQAESAEEYDTAYTNYLKTLSEAEGAVKLSATVAIEDASRKIENAEALTLEDINNITEQKARLEQVKQAVLNESAEGDLTAEAQAALIDSAEEFDQMIGFLDVAVEYAEGYEENRDALVENKLERIYGGYTIDDIQTLIDRMKKEGQDQQDIADLESYLENREYRERAAAGEIYYTESPAGSMYDKFQYLYDNISGQREEVEREYREGSLAKQRPNSYHQYEEYRKYELDRARLGRIYEEDKPIYDEMLRDVTLYYHTNLISYSESLFTPEELEYYADLERKEPNEYLKDTDYSRGREGVFDGNYSSFYSDYENFLQLEYGDFTKEEGDRVLAIMHKYGTAAAFDYYAAMREQVFVRQAAEMNGFAAAAIGITSGLTNFFKNGITVIDNAMQHSYARVSGDIMTAAHQVTTERLDEMGMGGDALELLYGAGYSIVNMIPAVALSAIPYVGKGLAAGYMYASSFANSYAESIKSGKRADEAVTYSSLVATAETTLGIILGGVPQIAAKAGLSSRLKSGLSSLAKTNSMKTAIKIASSMGSEGFEEFLQEALSPFLAYVAADLNHIDDHDLEAIDWEEAAKSFVVGSLVGGVFDGVHTISTNRGLKHQEAQQLMREGTPGELIAEGARLGSKRAADILKAWQKKEPIYPNKTGWAAYASEDDLVNIRQSNMRHLAQRRLAGVEEKLAEAQEESAVVRRAFKKMVYGKTITTNEAAGIINSPAAASILSDMLKMDAEKMLPDDLAALVRLGAFTINDKAFRNRLDLFRDDTGSIDLTALKKMIQYADISAKMIGGGIVYEAEYDLTESERAAIEALKVLSRQDGTVFFITETEETGVYLADSMMAVNRNDIGGGVADAAFAQVYDEVILLRPDHAAAFRKLLLERIREELGEDGYQAAIAEIKRQMALTGEDVTTGEAEGALCARMMAALLRNPEFVTALIDLNNDVIKTILKSIAAIQNRLKMNNLLIPQMDEAVRMIQAAFQEKMLASMGRRSATTEEKSATEQISLEELPKEQREAEIRSMQAEMDEASADVEAEAEAEGTASREVYLKDLQAEAQEAEAQEATDEDADEVMDMIGARSAQRRSIRDSLKQSWEYGRRVIVDSGTAVYDLGQKLEDPHLYAYYDAARASTQAAIYMITEEQTNVQGKRPGDSLEAIWAPIVEKGESYRKQFDLYLLHRHNIDRMSRKKNAAGALDEAKWMLDDSRSKLPEELSTMTERELRSVAQNPVHKYQREASLYIEALDWYNRVRAIRDVPVFGKNITADKSIMAVESLERKHPEFKEYAKNVYAYIDNLMQYRVDSGLITAEFAQMLKEIYPHYVPTNRVLEDPSPAKAKREKNRAQVGRTVGRAVGGDEVIKDVYEQIADLTISVVREGSKNRFGLRLMQDAEKKGYVSDKNKIKRIRKASEKTIDELLIDLHLDETDPFFRPENKNVIGVFKNGELYEMDVTEDLYEAMDALTAKEGELNRYALFRFAAAANKVFKMLVTSLHLTFLINNPTKDLQDAVFYSKNPKEWIKSLPFALREIKQNGKLWRQYRALGGGYSTIYDVETRMTKRQTGLKKITGRIEALNQAIEQFPRFTEFVATVKNGDGSMENLMDALYNAADITTNFGRSGKAGRMLNRYFVPFFNPSIQGFSKIVRTVTEITTLRGFVRLALKAVLFGIGMPMLNELMYSDDEEWNTIRQSDKDRYFLIKVNDGRWIKIPRGRILSVIGAAGMRVWKAATGEETEWASFADTAVNQIAPANPLTSNILAPLIAVDINRTWYGGEIVNQRLANEPDAEQYDTKTDELSKWLGSVTGLSPKKINYVIEGYSGVVGDILLPLLTPAAERTFLEKAFTLDTNYSNRLSGDFYDRLDELSDKKNSEGATPADQVLYRWWNRNASAVSEVNAAIREIEENDELKSSEKKELVNAQYQVRNALILGFEEVYPRYVEVVEKLSDEEDIPAEEAADVIYREANREVFGAEYAIQTYGSATYERALREQEERGIDFETFYDVYFDETVDADKCFEMIDHGIDQESAVLAARSMEAEEGSDYVSKYKAISKADLVEDEKVMAMSIFATDADRRRIAITATYNIPVAAFVEVREKIDQIGRSNAKIQAAIDTTEGLSESQKAIMWQVFTSSKSAKNNPYNQAIGDIVMDRIEEYKEAEEEEEE